MWSPFVLCLLVGFAYAYPSPAWKDNTEYVYSVRGRTLTSLQDQYSGFFLKANLYLNPRSDGKLQGMISDAKYAQIHSNLPDGWESKVPESQLSYKPLVLTPKPFQIEMNDGVITKLIVEKGLTNWEANIIKSIMSQFQLDIQGRSVIDSPVNKLPTSERFDGVFKTMEETITGRTETLYEVHPLPEYLLHKTNGLPVPKLKDDDQVIEVFKFKNYTNSEERPSYHYGFAEVNDFEPTSNKMGQFFVRQSTSRALLTGQLSRFVIQQTYTVNKILVNPTFNNKEMGSIVSMLNVTLSKLNPQSKQPKELSNPVEIGGLPYTYERPFNPTNEVHDKQYFSHQEDNSEENQSMPRYRRSAVPLYILKSGSAHENSQYQPRPDISQVPESPLLPNYMGYHGKSIKTNPDFDIKEKVEQLVSEITQEVHEPKEILRQSTLDKFTILCSLVRIMSEEEIRSVAEQWYTQSTEGQESLSWKVILDAIAEAGTGPAFLNIKEFIESNKIQEFQAAEIVATMANAVRVPTEEYMRKFYELIKTQQVKQEKYLNETAILSYTELVYRVYVKRNESHNEFPVHSFGTFYTKEGRDFIKTEVIPYLSQQLQQVISEADSRKIHVYIRALGNVAHKKILEAFEPYLEGDKQASQFQRMLMVIALDRLVEYNPEIARSVLYKIYQNAAEIPEIRVVAVYQIMKTNPPVEMLHRMAESTHTEVQEQVIGAVKSALESASRLQSTEQQSLKEAAESARHLLNKSPSGSDKSFIYLRDYVLENMDMEFDHKFLAVDSQDHLWPKTIKHTVRGNLNGMHHQYLRVSAMTSSIRELLNVFYRQTEEYQKSKLQRQQRKSGESKWSSANIADILNYEIDEKEQWEGLIVSEMQHLQKLWSFDNQSMERLPEAVHEHEEILKNGKQMNYNKLRQGDEKTISLPTEMGIPVMYTFDIPMLIKVNGSIQAVASPQISSDNKLRKPDKIVAKIDAKVTISARVQSHLSFVTPFDHQVYMAGFDKNVLVHLPIKAVVTVDVKNKQAEIKCEVEETEKDVRLLHYSTWPYTSRSDIMSIIPVALRPNTRIIKPKVSQYRYFDVVFGKNETGLAFRAWGHHPVQSMSFLELAQIMPSQGFLNVWQQLWDKAALQQTEANIAFIPSQSSVRKFTVRLGQHNEYRKKPEVQAEEEFLTYSQLSSKLQSDETKIRRDEMIKHVSSGLKSVQLLAHDLSVEFEGKEKYKHILGIAMAKSDAAPNSRSVIYYKKDTKEPKQFWLQVKGDIPNTNGLDLTYSLENEPKAEYKVRVQYGQSEEEASLVSGRVSLQRSKARKQYLIEREPLFEVCKKQMQEGNFQLSACQNLTIQANYLDDIKIEMQHKRLRKEYINIIEGVFKGLRVFYYPMTEIETIEAQEENKVSLRIQFQPENFRQVNFTVKVKEEKTRLFNISIVDQVVRSLVVPHPVFHLKARLIGVLNGWDNFRPTCVIDQTVAQTFSNRTYPLSLKDKYTVVMQYIPREARIEEQARESVPDMLRRYPENYVVLVRQSSAGKRELIITFNHKETQGKTVEISMKPKQQSQSSGSNPAATVLVDNQEMKFTDEVIADMYNGLVKVYALPNGEVKLEFQNAFYIIFDGKRFKVTATGSKLLDSISGLCGRFSKDQYEDFTIPSNCVVRDNTEFVQSYVVESRQEVPRSQRSQEYKNQCVPKVMPLYTDVISDRDVGRRDNIQISEGKSGIQLKHQYREESGQICFTIRPLPVCNTLSGITVSKNVPVHCIKTTKTAYYLKNQIDQGGNPDFSHKAETKKILMDIPMDC